jgi:glycosyltransferase involved in cell wall biosynthesis
MERLLIATTIPRTLDDFLLPYARHFRAKGWRVDALSGDGFEGTRAVEAFERTFTVQWSRNPLDLRNLASTPGQIRDIVAQQGYHIVHVHTPVAAFVTRLALRSLPRSRRPQVIYTAHGFHFHPAGSPLRNAIFFGLERIAGRWTDYLVVMNREDAHAARRHRLVPSDRLVHMPGIGVDTSHYSASSVDPANRQRFRQEMGLSDSELYFLMVAEFIPRKRHVDLLRAFALVSRGSPGREAHLALAGQGRLVEEMRSLARDLGIERRTHFLGQRSDVPALMSGAAAVVLPSVQEGLPRCVLEAMSMGTPVVATRIRGTAELLENGTGYLVEVGDVEGLASALRSVLARPDASREMGRRGIGRASVYDVRHVIQLHEGLYGEALGRLEEQRRSADAPADAPTGVVRDRRT